MSSDRARLLLHPVRMRVVVALGSRDLTTRQIGEVLDDVPQASLYRAIAQLLDAGVIEVVKEVRRGGAMERTYRMLPDLAEMAPEDFVSGSAEEFLATVQTFADLLVSITRRHVSSSGDEWRDTRYGFLHEALWLTDGERDQLAEEVREVYARYMGPRRDEGQRLWAFMAAAIPEHEPAAAADDHGPANAAP